MAGLLLAAFWPSSAQAQGIIDGFGLDQISFAANHTGSVPCSEYGHADFVVRQIPGQIQFVQIVARMGPADSPAWIVRNLPAVGSIVTQGTMVDLTQMSVARGTCINGSSIAYEVTVTDTPVSSAPSFTGNGLTAFVGQRTEVAEGDNPPGTLASPSLPDSAPPPPLTLQTGSTAFTDRQGMGNVAQGKNECAPSAVANSMRWLQASGSLNLGTESEASTLSKLKSDMQPSGWSGKGVTPTQTLEGKLRYSQRTEHPLDIVIHYQADNGLTGIGDSVSQGNGTATRDGNGGPPTFAYLQEQMQKGQDVELSIDWLDNSGNKTGGHVLAVSGVLSNGTLNQVATNDDSKQDGTGSGTRTVWSQIQSEGQYMKLGGFPRNRIKAIYAESPSALLFLELITQENANSVAVDKIGNTGALTPVIGSPFTTGTRPIAAATALGKFAYIANATSNNISAFKIDPSSGAFTAMSGSPFAAGQQPFSLMADPAGKFLYLANSGSNSVSAYNIDPTSGGLTPVAGSPFPAGMIPSQVLVDPAGAHLYVPSFQSNNISVFNIDPITGALTSITGSPFTTGPNPNSVALDPTGTFAYVANYNSDQQSGSVSAFKVDSLTGALTPVSGQPFTAGSQPDYLTSVRVGQPLNGYLGVYAANFGSNNVSGFTINPTSGALTPIPGSPFAAGLGPVSVAADPTSQFLFVSNTSANSVSAFNIDPSMGFLTPVSGSPFPVGQEPGRIATATVGTSPVLNPNPVPSISLLSPSIAQAGGPDLRLSVFGDNFVVGSRVQVNGQNVNTTFISRKELAAFVVRAFFLPQAALDAAAGTAQVTVVNPAPGGGTSSAQTFTVAAAGALIPDLALGGTVNAAGFQSGLAVAPGSIAAVFGSNMASQTQGAPSLPLLTTLGGTTLKFDGGVAAPLFFTSAGQINIQVPWELADHARAAGTLTTSVGTSAPVTINLEPYSPGIFTTNSSGSGQGAILIGATATVAGPPGSIPGRNSQPAKRGKDAIAIYCTGLGAVANQPADGAAALSNPLSATTVTPTVTIGDVSGHVIFSGLAPFFVGLYQVNVQVPASAPTGDTVPVVLTIGGYNSNKVTIAVQ